MRILNYIKYKFKSINEDQWLFTSFEGHYNDGPKALSEAIHDLYPNIKIFWGVKKELLDTLPSYIHAIEINSPEYFNIMSSSRVLIDNIFCNNAITLYKGKHFNNIKKRIKLYIFKKNQKCYSLWHGTPLKRMGRDQYGNENVLNFLCNDLTIIVGNEYTEKIFKNITFNNAKIEVLGMARNDQLFEAQNKIDTIKNRLDLPIDKKIVLYAPTFRSNNKGIVDQKNFFRSGISQLTELKIDEFLSCLSRKFGGDWILVCRFHYHVSSMIDWEDIKKLYNGKIINGNLSDNMSDYLICSDILLTDYSSCIFDFAIKGNPCFLYAPDLNYYKNKERGFYIPIEDLPFPLSCSKNILFKNINTFDDSGYKNSVKNLLLRIGDVDDGHSCKRIAKFIYSNTYRC